MCSSDLPFISARVVRINSEKVVVLTPPAHPAGEPPNKDIRIVYTGIRPGEKLYEELFTDKEGMGKTQHKRIFISHTAAVEQPDLQAKLTQLLAQTEDAQVIKHNIKNIVPEYTGMDF